MSSINVILRPISQIKLYKVFNNIQALMKKGDDTSAPISSAPTESTETYDTHSQGNIIMFIIKQKCSFFDALNIFLKCH